MNLITIDGTLQVFEFRIFPYQKFEFVKLTCQQIKNFGYVHSGSSGISEMHFRHVDLKNYNL
jgi:hypothetical protein